MGKPSKAKRARDAAATPSTVVIVGGAHFTEADLSQHPHVELAAFRDPAAAIETVRATDARVQQAAAACSSARGVIESRRRAAEYVRELVEWVQQTKRYLAGVLTASAKPGIEVDWKHEVAVLKTSLDTFVSTFGGVSGVVAEDTARLDEVYQEAVGLTRMLREQLGALVRAQPVMPMQRNVLLFAGAGADERRARTAGRRADKRARGADAAPP
jgi:hypothetical protein